MKQIIIIITFLMSGMCYGQECNDTIFFKNKVWKSCIIDSVSDNALFIRLKRFKQLEHDTVFMVSVKRYVIADKIQEKTILQDIKTEELSVFSLNNRINNIVHEQNRAGHNLRNAATLSYVSIFTAGISGLFLGLAANYQAQWNYESNVKARNSLINSRNTCYVFGGIFGVATLGCTLAIPINIGKAGQRLRNVK